MSDQLDTLRAAVAPDIEALEKEQGQPFPEDAKSDVILAKFLLGWGLDVEVARTKFLETLRWRIDENMLSVRPHIEKTDGKFRHSNLPHHETILEASGKCVLYDAGFSRDGHIVAMETIEGNPSSLFGNVDEAIWMEYYKAMFEMRSSLFDRASKEEKRIVKTVQIRDMHEIGLSVLNQRGALKCVRQVITMGVTHYPESISTGVFIQTPGFLEVLWKVFKPWIPERTQRKLDFVGNDFAPKLMTLLKPVQIAAQQRITLWGLNGEEALPFTRLETYPRKEELPPVKVGARGSQQIYFPMRRNSDRSKLRVSFDVDKDIKIEAEYLIAVEGPDMYVDDSIDDKGGVDEDGGGSRRKSRASSASPRIPASEVDMSGGAWWRMRLVKDVEVRKEPTSLPKQKMEKSGSYEFILPAAGADEDDDVLLIYTLNNSSSWMTDKRVVVSFEYFD